MSKNLELIPSEIVKIKPYYDGNSRQTYLFLKKCDYICSMFKGKKEQDKYNF